MIKLRTSIPKCTGDLYIFQKWLQFFYKKRYVLHLKLMQIRQTIICGTLICLESLVIASSTFCLHLLEYLALYQKDSHVIHILFIRNPSITKIISIMSSITSLELNYHHDLLYLFELGVFCLKAKRQFILETFC